MEKFTHSVFALFTHSGDQGRMQREAGGAVMALRLTFLFGINTRGLMLE
jgi:hypothetical protein